MALKFTITTNAIEARHYFDSLARSQLPFAISKAVNRLAWDVRDEEQGDLGKYFDLRTNWLTGKAAMPVVAAKKKMYPETYAILGIKNDIAALAIEGGERSRGGAMMGVPLSNTGGDATARAILNPGKETLPPAKWPGRIVKEPKANKRTKRKSGKKPAPFYMKSKSGRTFVALRSTAARFPITYLYSFADRVDIPKSWPLIENVTYFVGQKYGTYLSDELDKAIRTMKV